MVQWRGVRIAITTIFIIPSVGCKSSIRFVGTYFQRLVCWIHLPTLTRAYSDCGFIQTELHNSPSVHPNNKMLFLLLSGKGSLFILFLWMLSLQRDLSPEAADHVLEAFTKIQCLNMWQEFYWCLLKQIRYFASHSGRAKYIAVQIHAQ